MKAAFLFTMDTLSAGLVAFILGLSMAAISYGMGGPAWLTDAIGWTVFGGVGVKLWTGLRALHQTDRVS
jgi:hypothetical protein